MLETSQEVRSYVRVNRKLSVSPMCLTQLPICGPSLLQMRLPSVKTTEQVLW